MAAARNVSAAHSTTVAPSFFRRFASLPIVVVFPVPLTPTTKSTRGAPERRRRARPSSRRLSDGRDENLDDLALEFLSSADRVRDFVLVHLLAERGEDFFGGAHADIGA